MNQSVYFFQPFPLNAKTVCSQRKFCTSFPKILASALEIHQGTLVELRVREARTGTLDLPWQRETVQGSKNPVSTFAVSKYHLSLRACQLCITAGVPPISRNRSADNTKCTNLLAGATSRIHGFEPCVMSKIVHNKPSAHPNSWKAAQLGLLILLSQEIFQDGGESIRIRTKISD